MNRVLGCQRKAISTLLPCTSKSGTLNATPWRATSRKSLADKRRTRRRQRLVSTARRFAQRRQARLENFQDVTGNRCANPWAAANHRIARRHPRKANNDLCVTHHRRALRFPAHPLESMLSTIVRSNLRGSETTAEELAFHAAAHPIQTEARTGRSAPVVVGETKGALGRITHEIVPTSMPCKLTWNSTSGR